MKFSRPELHADDESSVRSSAVRGNFTSGRRPLGSSSSVLKVPIFKMVDDESSRGVVVVVCTGIGKTIRSKSAANSGRVWDQKYRFFALCLKRFMHFRKPAANSISSRKVNV